MSIKEPTNYYDPPEKYAGPYAHGTCHRYNTGCRCDPCRHASATARRHLNARRRGLDTATADRRYELRQHGIQKIIDFQPIDWTTQAACAGHRTDDFFPTGTEHTPEAVRARDLCAHCPVVDDCLLYARANREQHGIWGGLPARKITKLRHLTDTEALEQARRIRDAWTPEYTRKKEPTR